MKKGLKILIPMLVLALIVGVFCIGAFADEGNEARIGDTEYATLAAAVNAINNDTAEGNEITILKDITGELGYGVKKTMTVNLNGHTLTSTHTDKTKPIFAVNESNVKLTITGEGSFVSSARFAQISSNSGAISGSTLDIKGTGKGITVTTTGEGATLLYLTGGGEIENVNFLCLGALSDSKDAHIQLYSERVSFKNCNIYSTKAKENAFYFAGIGAAVSLDGCYVTTKKNIFYGDYVSGIKNDDDFKVVDAKNSIFIATDGTAKEVTSVFNATPAEATKFSGTLSFENCECAAYRVFETGCASGKSDPAGSFADGYNLTINVKNSVIRNLVNYNSPQIVRGMITFNAENCFFNIAQGFSAASKTASSNWSDASKITLTNCYFNKDISTDAAFTLDEVGMLNRGYSWCLSAEYPDYPYFICLTADKPTSGVPAKVLIQNGQTKSYVKADKNKYSSTELGDPLPFLGTSASAQYKSNIDFGGEINMKLGRFDTVMDSDDAYYRFTYVDTDGTIPATPKNFEIPSGKDAYFVIGDTAKPTNFSYADYAVFVTDVDIKTNDFATNQINIIPQSRSTDGTSHTANKNFRIIKDKIGGLSAPESTWHHIQMIIYVKKTDVAANGNNVAYVDYGSTYYEVYVDGAKVKLGNGSAADMAVINNSKTLKTAADPDDATKTVVTGQDTPYYQGMRFSVSRTGEGNKGSTTGAELCVDNYVVRAYKNESDFVKGKLTSTTLYKNSGYDASRTQAIYKGEKYTTASSINSDGSTINLIDANASIKVPKDMSVIAPAGFTEPSVLDSVWTGYADTANGLFYGKNTVFKTDKAETSAVKVGQTLDVYTLSGTHTAYYAHSELSDMAGFTAQGVPYAGADNEQEYGWLIEGMLNKATVKLQRDVTIGAKYFTLTSTSQREINFDLAGHTLSKTQKSNIFSGLTNTTFNLYSSVPGGVLKSRRIDTAQAINGGATVFYVNGTGAVVNIGACHGYSGDNLTVYAAIFYDVAAAGTGAVCNVNGGNYVRYTADSRGMFSTRAENSVINLKNANVLVTRKQSGGHIALNIENGSNGTIIADGCTFYSPLKGDAFDEATPLFYDISQYATAKFTNCSFSNIAFNNSHAEADGRTSGSMILGSGNTYSASCDLATATFESGVSAAALKSGWKQTLVGGKTQLIVINVAEDHVESDAYVVTAGATTGIPAGAIVHTLEDQAFVTLGANQALVTFDLGGKTLTQAREKTDASIPDGFELPSAKAGIYSYEYAPYTETASGVTYITYRAEISVDFSLKSNISLENNFVYNVFVPKALVDSGDVDLDVLVCGKEVTLSETVTDGTDEYYVVYITDITAIMGGDTQEVTLTVNLGEDALTETASAVFSYSIPTYAKKLLAASGEENAKAMMANVLAYVKCAMDWAGTPYVEADGYAAVTNALADYAAESITPTDTTAIDFSAIAKRPDTLSVIAAVSGATFKLDSTVAVRFYLAESFTGTLTLTYKDLDDADVNTTFTVENGKVDGKNYVELDLKAYYVANDITISFTGMTATENTAFNLAAYVVGCPDAEATTVAKALYAYATSALAYQNQK